MIFPEQLIETGINAPKEHQRVISKLTTGSGSLYYQQQQIALEPVPETMLDEGQTSPVPDMLLYDNQQHTTPIIISPPERTETTVVPVTALRSDYRQRITSGARSLTSGLRIP